jgi:HD-GYP domain-containing protein (c-di-GMP phosphodiesterase class II)
LEKRLSVDQLTVGMFIVQLDRPWLDTPFLLQGFLIEDEGTLDQLREMCDHVTVDPSRSVLDDLSALGGGEDMSRPARASRGPASAEAPRTTQRPTAKRTSRSVNGRKGTVQAGKPIFDFDAEREARAAKADAARRRASSLAVPARNSANALTVAPPIASEGKDPSSAGRDWLSSLNLFGWLRDNLGGLRPAPTTAAAAEQESHPPEVFADDAGRTRIRTYQDIVPLEDELGPANEGFARATRVLERVIRDIRQGKGLEIEAVENVVQDLVESIIRNPDALQLVSRLRESDESAYTHALQVAVLLVTFGRELGFSRMELEHLGQVGMLLDIGKLRIPRAILSKRGNLTPGEFEEVKRHVEYGLEMIGNADLAHPDVIVGVAQHHERTNGSGYPGGLKDQDLSIFGRMAGIVDSFCALTSTRPYADPLPPYDAMQLLQSWSDTYFNSGLVELFIQSIGIFPIGSLVELHTGEVAIVIGQHKAHRLKPKVLVIADPDKTPLETPAILDLLSANADPAMPFIRRGLPLDSFGVDPQEYYLSQS